MTTLRPMSLGELLDRSFFLYRKHFALFAGIIALPNLAVLAFQLLQIAIARGRTAGFAAAGFVWLLATMILYLGASAASQGATVVAVSKVHLGGSSTISEAFSGIRGRILYLSLIMIGVGIGIGIGFILLIVPGIIFALMWSLTIPVAVLEDKGLRDATSRSAELTKGNRGRIFMIYFLFIVLMYIVILLWEVPVFAAIGIFARSHRPMTVLPVWTQIAFPVCTFLSQCLVGPLLTIALSLVYYDQRVRKEAFDLELMMSTLDSAQGGTTPPTLPSAVEGLG
jgi:Membrane domain of glycerophosphoryl diester phosphodiesterase